MIRIAWTLSLCLFVGGLLCLNPPSRAQLTVLGTGGGGFGGTASCSFPTLTNLVGDYRADTGVTTSSGNVTAVVNQITPGTGDLFNVGTVPFTASSAYNSKPAFGFAAANDATLTTGSSPGSGVVTLPVLNRLSAFFVGQMTTSTANFGRAIVLAEASDPDFNNTAAIVALLRDGTTAAIETFYNGAAADSTAFSTSTNVRLGVVIDGSTITHYVNGVAGTPVSFTLSNLLSPTNIVIGNEWDSGGTTGGSAWDGPILHVVVASAALNSTEVGNLNTFFTCKYGT